MIDCAESYDTLYVQPAVITLMCGDGNSGVEEMAWTRWGASTATGQGEFFADQCIPNCAQGKRVTFPVRVTLSGVKTSSHGAYFSELKVAWEGRKPPNSSQSRFPLTRPSS